MAFEGGIGEALADDSSLFAMLLLVNHGQCVRGPMHHGGIALGLFEVLPMAVDIVKSVGSVDKEAIRSISDKVT